MRRITARALGALAVVGSILAVFVSIPSHWYGVPRTGAHVFNPAPFTPLWISRTVVPALTVLAGGFLLAGFLALVFRDRATAGTAHRLAGYAGVVALAIIELTLVALALTGGLTGTSTDATGALVFLVSFLAGAGGAVLLLVAMVVTGLLYIRGHYLRVGVPLVAGPALFGAVLLVSVLVGNNTAIDVSAIGAILTIAPIAGSFLAIGYDLWTQSDPVLDRDA